MNQNNYLMNFIIEGSDTADTIINTYTGTGGYATYLHEIDGYPTSLDALISVSSNIFHDPGICCSISTMNETVSENLSCVNKDGKVHKISGSGEHTFSKIRYIRRTSTAYVYRCVISDTECDIRMILNGANYKVLEGAPGIYEIGSDFIESYNYSGRFTYVGIDNKIFSHFCAPILFHLPGSFYYDSSSKYVGLQLCVGSRLFNWYIDHPEIYDIVKVVDRYECVTTGGSYRVTHSLIVESNHELKVGSSLYFSQGKVVWIGPSYYSRFKKKAHEYLYSQYSPGPSFPQVSLCTVCADEHIVCVSDPHVHVTPYTRSVHSPSKDGMFFSDTSELKDYLLHRLRPYSITQLVASFTSRGILVNYMRLVRILLSSGFYLYGPHIRVLKSSKAKKLPFDKLCCSTSKSYVEALQDVDYPWFSQYNGFLKDFPIGVFLYNLPPILLPEDMYISYNHSPYIVLQHPPQIGGHYYLHFGEILPIFITSTSFYGNHYKVHFSFCDPAPSCFNVVMPKRHTTYVTPTCVGRACYLNDGDKLVFITGLYIRVLPRTPNNRLMYYIRWESIDGVTCKTPSGFTCWDMLCRGKVMYHCTFTDTAKKRNA